MIQRRQFLGSVAAFCATSASLTQLSSAAVESGELNWHCDVVETVPHNRALRRPVVTDVSIQPAGDLLAIVGDDHFVCIYNTRQKQFTQHLDRHTDWIRTARFSPDGTKLATAGNDRTLLIWRADDWKNPAVAERNPEAIIDVAFTNDGKRLVTVGFESTLRIFDVASGDQLEQLQCPCPDNHAVAFSRDDRFLAVGGRSGIIRVWDLQGGRQVTDVKVHRQRIRSLEFTADGKILSASDDQLVKLTDPTDPREMQSFPRHASKLYATALLGNGLIATGGSDNKIHVWQLGALQEAGTLIGHTGTVSCLDCSRSQLVSGSFDTHVRLWSVEQNNSTPKQRHTQLRDGWSRKLN